MRFPESVGNLLTTQVTFGLYKRRCTTNSVHQPEFSEHGPLLSEIRYYMQFQMPRMVMEILHYDTELQI